MNKLQVSTRHLFPQNNNIGTAPQLAKLSLLASIPIEAWSSEHFNTLPRFVHMTEEHF